MIKYGLRIGLGLVSIGLVIILVQLANMPRNAASLHLPILVPITGFLSLEGTSQRNGALMALEQVHDITTEVIDTGVSPEGAITAFRRALEQDHVGAIVASMLGTQMLTLLPLAQEYGVPLITVSGTAAVTEQENRYVFRFFPADPLAKLAHARYVAQVLGSSRPALISQTTAYGQSGRQHLMNTFSTLGIVLVADETLDTSTKDMSSVLRRVLGSKPDVLVLHLHASSTALVIRQLRALDRELPVVAGSAMHQPTTAALLEPTELINVCAETASSPITQERPEIVDFVTAYRREFDHEPDAFALGQFDGVMMVLKAVEQGATTAEQITQWLETHIHQGLAMTYRSDGHGNMAHSMAIICYDGITRIPRIVMRYSA